MKKNFLRAFSLLFSLAFLLGAMPLSAGENQGQYSAHYSLGHLCAALSIDDPCIPLEYNRGILHNGHFCGAHTALSDDDPCPVFIKGPHDFDHFSFRWVDGWIQILDFDAYDEYMLPFTTCVVHRDPGVWSVTTVSHYRNCTFCGFQLAFGAHTMGNPGWFNNSTHIRRCTTCNYGVTEAHNYGAWNPDPVNNNIHWRRCRVCQGEQSAPHTITYGVLGGMIIMECKPCGWWMFSP